MTLASNNVLSDLPGSNRTAISESWLINLKVAELNPGNHIGINSMDDEKSEFQCHAVLRFEMSTVQIRYAVTSPCDLTIPVW